jgi:hypothetical protein
MVKYFQYFSITLSILIAVNLAKAQCPLDKEVSIGMYRKSLQDFLVVMKDNAGYRFCIEEGELENTIPITFRHYSATIQQIFDSAFSDQPYKYFIVRNCVVIVKRDYAESLYSQCRCQETASRQE